MSPWPTNDGRVNAFLAILVVAAGLVGWGGSSLDSYIRSTAAHNHSVRVAAAADTGIKKPDGDALAVCRVDGDVIYGADKLPYAFVSPWVEFNGKTISDEAAYGQIKAGSSYAVIAARHPTKPESHPAQIREISTAGAPAGPFVCPRHAPPKRK